MYFCSMSFDVIKSLHIIFVVCWFAGTTVVTKPKDSSTHCPKKTVTTNNTAVKALAQRLTERRARTEQPAGDLLRERRSCSSEITEAELVTPKALQDGARGDPQHIK